MINMYRKYNGYSILPQVVAKYTYTQLPNEIAQFLPNEDELKQLIQDDEDK